MDAPIREYLDAVQRHARRLSLFFPDALRQRFNGDLLELFVPVRLRAEPRRGADATRPLLAPAELLARREGQRTAPHVLVIGEAGSGKSTLLSFLAARAWESREAIGLDQQMLPMLVSARSLAKATGAVIGERLRAALGEDRRLTLTSPLASDFVSEWARRTRRGWLFLLDGLDEVPQSERADLFAWLERFQEHCSTNGHRVVITGRPLTERIAVSDRDLATFRLVRLEADQAETLSRKILGRHADRFLSALRTSRLAVRLRNPLLLTLAAAVFEKEGRVPTRRADLFEHIIDRVLEHACERRLRERLGDTIAAAARPLLELLTAKPESSYETAVARFLEEELRIPAAEAQGRAPSVVSELATSSGVLVTEGGRYVFSHDLFLEHLTACGMRKRFATTLARDVLVERLWKSNGAGLLLAFLGVLNDDREVSRLLGNVYPHSWTDAGEQLRAARFVVHCVLDGNEINPALRKVVEGDLRRLSSDPQTGPSAAELLGLLGDPGPLLDWVKSRTGGEEAVAYAASALVLQGSEELLHPIVRDGSAPLLIRIIALNAQSAERGPRIAGEVLRGRDNPPELRAAAALVLVRSGAELTPLLREGVVDAAGLNAIAFACAQNYQLRILIDAGEDERIDEATRAAIKEHLPVVAVYILKRVADGPTFERPVRMAASWILEGSGDPPDLAPLLVTPAISTDAKYAAVKLALLLRQPAVLASLCQRSDVPQNVQRFVAHMLAVEEAQDEIERIALAAQADPVVRAEALGYLNKESLARALRVAVALLADPVLHPVLRRGVQEFVEQKTKALEDLVRDETLDNARRAGALYILAEAGCVDTLLRIMRGLGSEADMSLGALQLSGQLGYWPVVLEAVRDSSFDDKYRAAALALLLNGGRRDEVEKFVESDELPWVLRAVAYQLLSKGSP